MLSGCGRPLDSRSADELTPVLEDIEPEGVQESQLQKM